MHTSYILPVMRQTLVRKEANVGVREDREQMISQSGGDIVKLQDVTLRCY